MSALFITACIQAFFFGFLLFTKKNKSLADKVLAAWLVTIGIHLLGAYQFQQGNYLEYPVLWISTTLSFLHAPMFWLYIRTLTTQYSHFRPKYYGHFLPFVVCNALLMPFYLKDKAETIQMFKTGIAVIPQWMTMALNWFGIVSALFYLLWIGVLLWQHRKNLVQFFSFTEKVDLRWIWFLLGSHVLIWFIVFFAYLLPYKPNVDVYIFSAVSLFIFGLGYFGYKQQAVFQDNVPVALQRTHLQKTIKPANQPNEIKYQASGLKPEQAREYLQQLEHLMLAKKPYLEPKLTLSQLAQQTNITTHYLTELLNHYLQQSFFDYINLYRVSAVKEKIADKQYQHYTLLAIALDCGFNSKSSFNRIFKKVTGQTPSEYKKRVEF